MPKTEKCDGQLDFDGVLWTVGAVLEDWVVLDISHQFVEGGRRDTKIEAKSFPIVGLEINEHKVELRTFGDRVVSIEDPIGKDEVENVSIVVHGLSVLPPV